MTQKFAFFMKKIGKLKNLMLNFDNRINIKIINFKKLYSI